ncbi:cytolysin secretion protein [Vibrio vulnificus]
MEKITIITLTRNEESMLNNKNRNVGHLTLLCCLFAANAFADVQILGSESELSQTIAEQYQQNVTLFNGQLNSNDVLYVNVGTATDDEITQAKSHIISGSTVVIDLTQIAGDDARLDWSQKLTGLGLSAPVVVTGVYQGDALVNAIVSDVTDENDNPINDPQAELESVKLSLTHALDRFQSEGK